MSENQSWVRLGKGDFFDRFFLVHLTCFCTEHVQGGPGTERNDEQTNYFLKDYII